MSTGSATLESFWLSMDARGEHIANREERKQGETNGEESSIRTNTSEFSIKKFRVYTYKSDEEYSTFGIANFSWYGK